MTDHIVLSPVEPSRHDEFLRLPEQLYRDLPHWVPPLRMERRAALLPGATPYVRRARMQWWLASRNGRPVGRISAQIDPAALAREPGIGHFGLLAAENDPKVLAALLGAAEGWLRDNGMTHARGPFDLSVNQECGVLVDGFHTPPMMMMPHNPPWLGPALEALGYGKAKDLLAYCLDCSGPPPEKVARLLKRPLPRGLTIRPLRLERYGEEIACLAGIFNDAWAGNWGFVPFDPAEVELLARELRPLIQRDLVWFAEIDGQAEAFIVCLPNLNEAIADLGGALWPTGWAKLLWRLKVSGVRSARVPLMGVRRAVAATLAGGLLPFHLIGAVWPHVVARGMKNVELSWVLEDNRPMRAMAEALSGPAYKTYRLYEKALS